MPALRSAYLICGEETLEVLEHADRIRAAARAEGFEERLVFDIHGKFDWNQLVGEAQAMSLFASRRVFDLRFPTGKAGREGGKILKDLINSAGDDILYLITAGKMDKSSLSTAWAKAVQANGDVVQYWPVKPQDLPQWLERRIAAAGLMAEPRAIQILASRIEGNLLAAAQEIDKLKLLCADRTITAEDVASLVADSARFQIFLAVDAAVAGATKRALRYMQGLRRENFPLPVLSSLLARQVRTLVDLRLALDTGANMQAEYRNYGLWADRKSLFERAVRRRSTAQWQSMLTDCATLDRAIKGRDSHDPWQLIDQIVVAFGTR